ncbi:MAG: peptidoglycan recognition family protein [Actinomycetes bacterium]
MEIVQRETWGAAHEDGFGSAPVPAGEVWLHHSVTIAPDLVPPFDDEDQAVRLLERIGEQRFGRGISYTFAVMPSGRVYEGHSPDRQGAHLAKRNSVARAIVLVGNYDVDEPTAEQVASTAQLLVDGQAAGWWKAARLNGGHRDAPGAATVCPGRHGAAVLDAINDAAAKLKAGPVPAPAPPAPDPLPPLPAWPMPGGHYFGHIAGPRASHGGYFEHERPAVTAIQARFVAAGCVPGVAWGTDRARRWCDGRWENPTTEACRRWFARARPGQPFTTRIYRDDYAAL